MGLIIRYLREHIVKKIDRSPSKYIFEGKQKRYRPTRFLLGLFPKKVLENEFDKIFSRVSKSSTILDVGSGMGLFAEVLLKHFSKVYALEASLGMLCETHRRSCLNENYIRINADIFYAPFQEHIKFDAIFCADVLHHIEKKSEFFQILKDLLKEDGKLIIVDYTPGIPKTKRVRLFEEFFIEDLHLVPQEELESYFSDGGFCITHHPISRFEYIFVAEKGKGQIQA